MTYENEVIWYGYPTLYGEENMISFQNRRARKGVF